MDKDVIFGGIPTEIEILEFKAGGNSYGVDVSDIKEILPYDRKPTPIPNAHPFIEGILKPRDFLIPIVNFISSLKLSDIDEDKHEMLIVTGINDLNIAFRVDSVSGIHRVVNSEFTKPGKKLTTSQKDIVVAVLPKDDRKIEVIDFRKVMTLINPDVSL